MFKFVNVGSDDGWQLGETADCNQDFSHKYTNIFSEKSVRLITTIKHRMTTYLNYIIT